MFKVNKFIFYAILITLSILLFTISCDNDKNQNSFNTSDSKESNLNTNIDVDEYEEDDEDLASKDDFEYFTDKDDLTEEVFDKLNVYRVRSEEEISYINDMIDTNVIQFYYVPHSSNSKKIALELYKLNRKINHMAAIMLVNCLEFVNKDTFKHCVNKSGLSDDKYFPIIRMFVPPEKRMDLEKTTIKKPYDIPYVHSEYSSTENNVTSETLYNFIINHLTNRTINLDNYNFKPFFNSDLMKKIVLFQNSVNDFDNNLNAPLNYKGIANKFYDQLLFGYVNISEETLHKINDNKIIVNNNFIFKLIKDNKINKLPYIISYSNFDREELLEEPVVNHYIGSINDKDKLDDFLNKYILPEKRYISVKRGIVEETGEDLARIINLRELEQHNFAKYFNKFNKENKIMVLFNTKNKLKISVKKYLVEGHGAFFSVFFNCKTLKEYCFNKFGVKTFPSLKLFEKNSLNINDDLSDFSINIKPTSFNTENKHKFLEDFNKYFDITSKVEIANETNFPYIIQTVKDSGKFALITLQNYEKQEKDDIRQNISFKLLSFDNEINKYIDFIIFDNPSPAAIEQLRVERYPYLVFYYSDSKGFHTIPINPDILYSSLKIISENLIYHRYYEKERRNYDSEFVKQITTNSELNLQCNEYGSCLLAFLEVEKNNEEIANEFSNNMVRYEIMSNKEEFKSFNYGWLNTNCHKNLLDLFKLDSKGGLVYYNKSLEVYSSIKFPIDDVLFKNFYHKVAEKKLDFNHIDIKNAKIIDNTCMESFKHKSKKEKNRKEDL